MTFRCTPPRVQVPHYNKLHLLYLDNGTVERSTSTSFSPMRAALTQKFDDFSQTQRFSRQTKLEWLNRTQNVMNTDNYLVGMQQDRINQLLQAEPIYNRVQSVVASAERDIQSTRLVTQRRKKSKLPVALQVVSKPIEEQSLWHHFRIQSIPQKNRVNTPKMIQIPGKTVERYSVRQIHLNQYDSTPDNGRFFKSKQRPVNISPHNMYSFDLQRQKDLQKINSPILERKVYHLDRESRDMSKPFSIDFDSFYLKEGFKLSTQQPERNTSPRPQGRLITQVRQMMKDQRF